MNKPVAWIGETLMGRQYINGQKETLPVGTPLYTHQLKELSDEEIHAVWASGEYYTLDKNGNIDEFHFADFAKAILRKASEK